MKNFFNFSSFKKNLRRFKFLWIGLGLIIVLITSVYLWALAHKKEILASALSAVNQKISGQIYVDEVDFSLFERFPNVSLVLTNVRLTDSLVFLHHDTLFAAKRISLQIRIPSLLEGEVSFSSLKIDGARISILKTKEGMTNTKIAGPARATPDLKKKKLPLSVSKVFLKDVRFAFTDSMQMKFFSFQWKRGTWQIAERDSLIVISLNDQIHFDELTFNAQKGGYLTNQDVNLKTDIEFNPDAKQLDIKNGKFTVQQERFNLSGQFLLTKSPEMELNISSLATTTRVAFSILPRAISEKISKYKIEKPLMTVVHVKGSILPGSKPAVDIFFKSKNNRLSFANKSFDSLQLLGWFTNHIDSTRINDDHNTRIYFPVFNAAYYKLPMKSKLIITDLQNPFLYMVAAIHVGVHDVSEGFDTERFRILGGVTNVDFTFNGPLMNFVDSANNKLAADITGSVQVDNLSLNYIRTGYEFRNINSSIRFDENDLQVDSLNMEINGNRIGMKGSIQQFISFLFLPDTKANAQLSVVADTFDFNSFKNPAAVADSIKKLKKSNPAKKNNQIASTIDRVVDKLELQLSMEAKKIVIGKLESAYISANLIVANDYFSISRLFMESAGGTVFMQASVSNLNGSQHPIMLNAKIQNVDISTFMYRSDNLGQTTLGYKNIDGKISATMDLTGAFSRNYKLLRPTLKGHMDLKITNGQLKDVEALSQISKYVFKNRDFSNIEFAELNNKYEINGPILNISKLEVYSSVMTLFVEGIYDMDKVNTNLLIRIPFSNLKKADAEQRMNERDSSGKKGGNFYFRATNNKQGKIGIAPVVFGSRKVDAAINPEDGAKKKRKKN